MNKILTMKNIRKSFSGVEVLHSVDLDLFAGEVLALIGENGAGKSTLMNVLGLLDRPSQGSYRFDGDDVSRLSTDEQAHWRNRRFGFVFQAFRLLPRATAVENVELPLLVSGVGLGEARKRALEALDQVGLSPRAQHKPAELSGGERQRTTIARALVNRPALVWADEPTGDLDSETAGEIMDVLVDLNQRRGLTFILVTHDRAVGARCGRIVRMRDGQVEAAQAGAGGAPGAAPGGVS